jgi:hypothetical protein
MGRRRKHDLDDLDVEVDQPVPEHTHEFEHEHKTGRARRLALLVALAGGVFYMLRRRQQRSALDEGVWHEAPSA